MGSALSGIEDVRKSPLLEAIENSKKMAPAAIAQAPFIPHVFQDRLEIAQQPLEALSSSQKASRPELPSPLENESRPLIWDLLALQINAEGILEHLTASQGEEFKEAIKRYEAFAIEMSKKQRDLVDTQANADTWERYREISSAITTAMTFFAAAAVAAGGPATAPLTYALLVSGSSALVNQGLTLSGGWNWFAGLVTSSEESQVQLASILEKSVTIGSTLLGLVGLGFSATSLQAAPLWTRAFSAESLPSGITTVANVATAFIGIRSGIATSKNYDMQKEGKISEDGASHYKYHSNELAKALHENADNQLNLHKACEEAVQSYLAALRLAGQPA